MFDVLFRWLWSMLAVLIRWLWSMLAGLLRWLWSMLAVLFRSFDLLAPEDFTLFDFPFIWYNSISTFLLISENFTSSVVRIIGSYMSPYWTSGISSTSVRNSVFSRVERRGTSRKTLNFSHEWKKSQIFNKDECKYLFLQFQLKNKGCRFHSFILMSMSCLLHKILQRHVQCSKYTLI